jgi:Cu/Ag efflux protein CusF
MNISPFAAALAFVAASALAAEPTPAEGEVRRTNSAGQEITLKHGEIKVSRFRSTARCRCR